MYPKCVNYPTLEPGDSIDLPPNSLHTFTNAGDGPCRWLNVHSPKGFLTFFETFGVDSNQEDAFQKSVDGQLIADVLRQAASYDMHIQLPQ
ncbi:cupin domain-containing protein [Spirosoma endbachense]|uniref:cupin domain-containing protein n=1 Tax=Spirosoma endbachense TaxID=2666025 RepID=UPI0021CF95C8|nr:cupin domain-containing protein [Spirosoma endbachense]